MFHLLVATTVATLLATRQCAAGEGSTPDPVCVKIGKAVSSASTVYYPGQAQYDAGLAHWASSSTQLSKCVVEPGTAADVGKILNIVGSTKTPFAVKGGGHATNPGFSSTTGVHISMSRFNKIKYNEAGQAVTFGSGLIWDDVSAALDPHQAMVVGGRVSGVGVAGFTLGGGYSWLTNQYGLTLDTVIEYELVKSNGDVVTVNKKSNPDLFWGLKGGSNNFGIVTKFTLKTYPYTQVWGGSMFIDASHIPLVAAATADFSANVKDPKAEILITYNFVPSMGQALVSQMLFYDGPNPPAGMFDAFLNIPYVSKDIEARNVSSLLKSTPSDATYGLRAVFQTVSLLAITPKIMDAVLNETMFWGAHLGPKNATILSFDVEPFLADIYKHNTSPSAYPPNRSAGFLPFNIYFGWTSSEFDNEFHDAARQSATQIYNAAIADGQAIAGLPVYPNYAIFGTPLLDLYGRNVARLKSLKRSVDPKNIMGLAGGFKL